MTGLSGAQLQHKRKAPYLHARPIAHAPPLSSGGTLAACVSLFRWDNVVWKVINIGNVPVMGTGAPSNGKENQMRAGAPDSSGDRSFAGRLSKVQINK